MSRVTAFVLIVCLVCAAGAGTVLVTDTAAATSGPKHEATDQRDEPTNLKHEATNLKHEAADPSDTAAGSPAKNPRIVSVYPNPVAHGDAGEHVTLWIPPDRGPLVLTDGQTTITVAGNVSGWVVVTDGSGRAPANSEHGGASVEGARESPQGHNKTTRGHANRDPHRLTASGLTLANSGGQLRLRTPDGRTHHIATYGDAPEGERWITTTATWQPLGYEPREPRQYEHANATVFTLPDATSVPQSTLQGADERIFLAGYTLTSEAVVETLLAARQRGVRVRVLLERSPVGGMTRRQAAALDRLTAAGVEVRLLGGPRSRFSYHHAKYAVVDEQALVLTENWKPAGTGGHGSRGWGVTSTDSDLASGLAALFVRDAESVDAMEWSTFRQGRTFAEANAATGEYPSEIAPESVRVDSVRLLTAPGNAETEMVAEIDSATESVLVVQSSIERDSPLVEASIRAASRGVEVRILLSDAWYVADDNRDSVAALNDHADRRGLPLTARIDRPRGQYEKIHAKGLVVDRETAYVGSLNWNSQAAARNREVVLELRGEQAAGYFANAFETDWKRGSDRLPVGLTVATLVAVVVAAAVARRQISFGDGTPIALAGDQHHGPEKGEP